MASWPAIDEKAVVTLACCGEQLTARVLSTDSDRCTVRVVSEHECDQGAQSDVQDVLSWFTENRCWARAISVAGSAASGAEIVWNLDALGESECWQRREYVRMPTSFAVSASDPSLKRMIRLEGIDLSEGGVRCWLLQRDLDLLPPHALLKFEIEGVLVDAVSRLAWSGPDDEVDPNGCLAGFEFTEVGSEAKDAIRAYTMRLQLEIRRERFTHSN